METRAKKSLGQHFLKDQTVIEHILAVAQIAPEEKILEIGPGTGALTEKLIERVKKVIAIELDHQMVEYLTQTLEASQGFSLLEANVLEVDLNELLVQAGFESRGYKIVANLPYYITAPIIRTLLSLEITPKSLILMVQKEVAERITAKPGSMSLLSLMVQYYADARIAFTVAATAFDPAPAVESAVIELRPMRVYDDEQDRRLFRIARAGFAARRKTLANNFASSFQIERMRIEQALSSLGLRADIRAQALSVAEWRGLVPVIENLEREKQTSVRG